MTPFELRFDIYNEAKALLTEEYYAKIDVLKQSQKDFEPESYPRFPNFEDIFALAEKINKFVSEY